MILGGKIWLQLVILPRIVKHVGKVIFDHWLSSALIGRDPVHDPINGDPHPPHPCLSNVFPC